MNILIVAATSIELAFIEKRFKKAGIWEFGNHYNFNQHKLYVGVCGIGAMRMAFNLSSMFLVEKFDMAINAGICGSFDPEFKIGDVMEVRSERFGDLGAEGSKGNFLDLDDLELNEEVESFFVDNRMINPDRYFSKFPWVNGLTVNKIHGNQGSIQNILRKYPDIQVESMEGGGFFYGCLQANLPFMELRTVSNMVEVRNKENWNIPLAIKKLESALESVLEHLD